MDLNFLRSRQYGTIEFTSNALPHTYRIKAWETHNAHSLVALQADPANRTPFVAAGINLTTPGIDLARVQCSPHKVARTESEISTHPVQGAVVYINLNRRGTFWHRGQAIDLRPWQVLIVDGDQAFEREFQEGTNEYVLRIPRDLISQIAPQRNLSSPKLLDARPTARTGQAASALRNLAANSLRQTHKDWEGLASRTLSLLGWLLGEETPNLVTTAQQLISMHCQEPNFGATELAATLNISTRQLSRVFASEELSVAQQLLKARLQIAHQMLSGPEYQHLPLADIARTSGFRAQAHFSRAYRNAYGISPSQHRRELRAM